MPESSLTEEAAITPDGNVPAASARATIGVDATGIPSRMAPARGMIIDAHVNDYPAFGGRADIHPLTEFQVERDTPLLIHGGQSVLFLPRVLSSHTRMSISKSGTSRPRPQAPFPGRFTRS